MNPRKLKLMWGALAMLLTMPGFGKPAQDKEKTPPLLSPQQHFQAAQTFQIAGDLEGAGREYREAISGGLRQLGNLKLSRDDLKEGIALISEAVEFEPDDPEARIDLAFARYKSEEFEAT